MNTNVAFEIKTLLQSTHGPREPDITLATFPDQSRRWRSVGDLSSRHVHGYNEEHGIDSLIDEHWGNLPQVRDKTICGGFPVGFEKEPARAVEDTEDREVGGAEDGGFTTTYIAKGIRRHESAVIGTYVDPAIVPGFHYRVRLLGSQRHLFEGQALRLQSVGLGYGKRITFQGESLNYTDNYFWSDTATEGYGFSLQVLRPGSSFLVYFTDERPIGTAFIEEVHQDSHVIGTYVNKEGVAKHVSATFTATLTYDAERHGVLPLVMKETLDLTGTVIAVKPPRGKKAWTRHIMDVVLPNVGNCMFRLENEG